MLDVIKHPGLFYELLVVFFILLGRAQLFYNNGIRVTFLLPHSQNPVYPFSLALSLLNCTCLHYMHESCMQACMLHACHMHAVHAWGMHEACKQIGPFACIFMHAWRVHACLRHEDMHACLNSATQIRDSSPVLGLGSHRTTLARLIKLHDRLYLPVQTIYCVE